MHRRKKFYKFPFSEASKESRLLGSRVCVCAAIGGCVGGRSVGPHTPEQLKASCTSCWRSHRLVASGLSSTFRPHTVVVSGLTLTHPQSKSHVAQSTVSGFSPASFNCCIHREQGKKRARKERESSANNFLIYSQVVQSNFAN